MEQPEPLKQHGAHIADHTSLVDLGNAISATARGIGRLRDDVNDWLDGAVQVMDDGIEEARHQLDQARRQLAVAQAALSACRDSGYYDSEKEEYVTPSCSCEERDVERAEKEVSRIHAVIERLERIKGEVEREIYEYRQPNGIITPGGGDGVLEYLSSSLATAANDRMDHILVVVEQYLHVSIGKHDNTPPVSDMPAAETSERKVDKFLKGMERIKRRDAVDSNLRTINSVDTVAVCPACHRPLIACICPRDENQNFIIFNYGNSR